MSVQYFTSRPKDKRIREFLSNRQNVRQLIREIQQRNFDACNEQIIRINNLEIKVTELRSML